MMVWCHPNLEPYMEFGYRLHSIKPPPVSFTYLEVLKLILAYTHTCTARCPRTLKLACSTARKLIVSIDVAWLRFTTGLPSSEIIKVLKLCEIGITEPKCISGQYTCIIEVCLIPSIIYYVLFITIHSQYRSTDYFPPVLAEVDLIDLLGIYYMSRGWLHTWGVAR